MSTSSIRRAIAALLGATLAPAALASATVSLVAQSPRLTQVRITVATPAFTLVNTPSVGVEHVGLGVAAQAQGLTGRRHGAGRARAMQQVHVVHNRAEYRDRSTGP